MLGHAFRMKNYGKSHTSELTPAQRKRARKKMRSFLKKRNVTSITVAF